MRNWFEEWKGSIGIVAVVYIGVVVASGLIVAFL